MGESSNNIEIQEDNLIEQEFQALLTDYLHSNHRKKVDIIATGIPICQRCSSRNSTTFRRTVYTASDCRSAHRVSRNRIRFYIYLFGSSP